MDNVPIGFDAPDQATSSAARILRLLQINELREVQTLINQAIVAAQQHTADPRTDERLGKVGRG